MQERLIRIMRHIEDVKNNCDIIANKLIAQDEHFAVQLIGNSYLHDNSKFHGIEWLHLNRETLESNKELFLLAQQQHVSTNKHHPEYWSGIKNMPPIFLAEMVADCAARSSEAGTNIADWFKSEATQKFGFTTKERVYKDIKYFLSLLYQDRI